MNYNLLEEKWIPVLWKDGNTDRVDIIDALTRAGRIRQIAASNPMDRVAILRFLLALLYWCNGNPPDSFSGSSFPSDWFTKLADNKDCFNLLGEGKRFYQRRPGKAKKLPANYLIQEIPTGINFWHFKHATEGTDGLCPACCAMGLLRLPPFATSGGRGKPPGINAKPPIYVISLGSSLAETLLLSWRKVSDSNLGTPAWEKTELQLPKKGKVPLLTGLTWLPRRVWLGNPDESEENCISCGRKEPLIRQCVFDGIGSTKTEGDGQGRVWSDPHVICDSKDVIKPSNALDASDAAAGQWAKIMTGNSCIKCKYPNCPHSRFHQMQNKSLWFVGFATVQNDKYLEAMEYEIHLHSTPDEGKIQESIKKIEIWQKEGSSLNKKIRPKKSSRKHVEIRPIVDAIRPHVEGKVSAKSGELINGGDEAWEQAASEYSPMIAAIAKSLSPGFTSAAVQRRKQIADVKLNMQQNKCRPESPPEGMG